MKAFSPTLTPQDKHTAIINSRVSTCTAPLGKTWKRCTRHGVYPDDKCHLHTEHLSGTHVERSREDALRQRLHNERTLVVNDQAIDNKQT